MKLFDLHSLKKIIIYFRVWVIIECSGPNHFLTHLAGSVKGSVKVKKCREQKALSQVLQSAI